MCSGKNLQESLNYSLKGLRKHGFKIYDVW